MSEEYEPLSEASMNMALRCRLSCILLPFFVLSSSAQSSSPLFPIVQDGKQGYIDRTGKIAIPPTFDVASFFLDGLALVKTAEVGRHGFEGFSGKFFIRPDGEVAFKQQYDDYGEFHEGMARVCEEGTGIFSNTKWGFIDTSGKTVVEPSFHRVGDFSEGRAWVGIRHAFFIFVGRATFGFIDHNGNLIIPDRFDGAGNFSEGLANVVVDNKRGFIDTNGTMIIGPSFDKVGSFSEGLAWIRIGNKCGYIDREGTLVIDSVFDDARDFSEGMALAKQNGQWTYIDRNGRAMFGRSFQGAFPFSQSLAAVLVAGKWGYIGVTGDLTIDPRFDYAWSFSDGLARVEVNKNWGYIDRHGNYVWEPTH